MKKVLLAKLHRRVYQIPLLKSQRFFNKDSFRVHVLEYHEVELVLVGM